VEGVARRLESDEAARVSAEIVKKTLWGRLWEQIYRLRGWQPVLYEVSPASEE